MGFLKVSDVKSATVEACGCTLTPQLTDTTVKVMDAFYGAANVAIQT